VAGEPGNEQCAEHRPDLLVGIAVPGPETATEDFGCKSGLAASRRTVLTHMIPFAGRARPEAAWNSTFACATFVCKSVMSAPTETVRALFPAMVLSPAGLRPDSISITVPDQ
jgi:hypothetical protein